MNLFQIFDVSASGMNAQSIRLNTTASNLANAESVSSSAEQTYRARRPVFAAQLQDALGDGSAPQGVEVNGIVESQAPLVREYNPAHPMADKDGYVYMANVNPVEEMADMMSASRSFETSVEVMNRIGSMQQGLLRLGQG